MRTIWLLLLLCSCATISTAGMSESCKNAYNSCLNACPEAPRQGAINPQHPSPPHTQMDPAVAACTDDCNKRAKKCN